MFVFRKILRALFSSNTRFEMHPFALLPTRKSIIYIYKQYNNTKLIALHSPNLQQTANLRCFLKKSLMGNLFFVQC